MASFAKMFQMPISLRSQHRPSTALFGENGLGTMRNRTDIEACLRKASTLSKLGADGKVQSMPPASFVHITRFLEMLDIQDGRTYPHVWSLRPRIYTLLQTIGALEYMNDFVKHNIYDISIPYDYLTLPDFLKDDVIRSRFLIYQVGVLTQARHLEDPSEDHIYFSGSAEEHIFHYRPLGHGGFGYVDVVLSKLSAKCYARKRVARGRDSEDNRRAQHYLVEEIRVMKALRHRHLTTIIQSYSDSKYIGYLMEPIADCDLNHFLAKKPFPEIQLFALRQFFGCLASGVDYLHRQQIRHRDLKLQNVLVKNCKVFIADFGTAVSWTTSSRGTTQSRGIPVTQHYMAPEVDTKMARNVSSDMWSLGLVFLEILTVVKGHTLSRWRDHLKKKSLLLKIEPWPCRNLAAVHEWMAVLATTQRHEDIDDESLAWRDNEPLTWIKALLEQNPDTRLGSRALVTTIADSMYCRSFACPDCAEDLMDPHHRYSDQREWRGDSKDMIDAEVTALFSVVAETAEPDDDRKTQMVSRWLGETEEHHPPAEYEETRPLPIPGAFMDWLQEEVRSGEAPMVEQKSSGSVVPVGNNVSSQSIQSSLHDGGFIIDHEDDSEDDSDQIISRQTNELFPIIHDASSDSSEGSDRADSPMLDLILEECEELSTPDVLGHVNDGGIATTPEQDQNESHLPNVGQRAHDVATLVNITKASGGFQAPQFEQPATNPDTLAPPNRGSDGRMVRFQETKTVRYQYVEEDTSPQTIELWRAERALPPSGPLLEPMPKDVDRYSSPLPLHESKPAIYESPADAPTEHVLDQAMVKRLLKGPSPSAMSTKKVARPLVKPRQPIALPWYTSATAPVCVSNALPDAAQPRPLTTADDVASHVASAPIEAKGYRALESSKPTQTDNELLKSATAKLSLANVGRFNKTNKQTRRPERRSFDDDHFTPAKFIEAAWKSAEAADSLATSVASETTTRKLRGIKLVWDDKAYSYLERYSKGGKAAAVRLLLDQGCNCGTILKPRPKPLVNAIEGCSARHNKCVRALIKAGTDVNADHGGRTPIHRVVEKSYFHGYQKLLAMLLAAGAEMNSPDFSGEYPLTKIFKGAAGDVPLEEYQKDSLALIFHPRVQAAVDVNVRQPFTLDTPLHQAVRRRTAQAVALLIHKGANVNAKNASGTTPLLMAANQWRAKLSDQQERMLYYLLAAENIDVDARGGTLGRTALHHAAAAGCAVALDMLLERGASTNIVDKDGKEALAILEAGRDGGNIHEDYQVMHDMLGEY